MREPTPTRWTDQIWRAAWALLAASFAVSLAASVFQTTWPFLLVAGGTALAVRIAVAAVRARTEW